MNYTPAITAMYRHVHSTPPVVNIKPSDDKDPYESSQDKRKKCLERLIKYNNIVNSFKYNKEYEKCKKIISMYTYT